MRNATKDAFANAEPTSIFNKIEAAFKVPEKFDDIVLRQLESVIENSNDRNNIEQLHNLLVTTRVSSDDLKLLSFNTKVKINLKILESIKTGLKLYIEHSNRNAIIRQCLEEINKKKGASAEIRQLLNHCQETQDNILSRGLQGLQQWFTEHGEEPITQLKKLREQESLFEIVDFDKRSDRILVDKQQIVKLKELILNYVYQNPNIAWGQTYINANELTPDIASQIDQKAQAFSQEILDCIFPDVKIKLDRSLEDLEEVKKIVNEKIADTNKDLAKLQQGVENKLEKNTIISLYQKINAIKNKEVRLKLLNTFEPFYIDPAVENVFINHRNKSFAELNDSDDAMRIEFKKIQAYLSQFKPLSEAQLVLKEEVLKWLTNFITNKEQHKNKEDEVVLAKQLTLHLVQTLYRAQQTQCDDNLIGDILQMQEALQASSHDELKKICTQFTKKMECHAFLFLTNDHTKRNFNPPSVNDYAMTDDKYLQLYAQSTSKLNENVPLHRHGELFRNLLLGFKDLVMAGQLGNSDAKKLLGGRILSSDQSATIKRLFFEKLKTYTPESKFYQEAQFKLALGYYSQRYQKIYTNYEDRLLDLYMTLTALQQSGNLNRVLRQVLQLEQNQSLDKGALQLSAYKLLLLELTGRDPLVSLFPNPTVTYPFQYSEAKLKEILESGFSKREDKDEFIVNFTRNQKTKFALRSIPCTKENDSYTISITALKFDNVIETKSFVDTVTHEEIARLINKNGTLQFVGFKNPLNLKIEGQLTGKNYIFDNDGDLKLTANFNPENNLNIISHTKTLDFKGNINSKASVNFENSGAIAFDKATTINCDKYFNLSSAAIQLGGKISAESAQIALDQSLMMEAESGIKANDIIISAEALKDLRGEIHAERTMQVRCGDDINLNGKGSLFAKEQLYLKTKTLSATDESSLKSEHMYVITDESISIDKESAWTAKEINLNSKIIKNNSPHLQFDTAAIHVSDQFSNNEHGKISTKEQLSLTGDDVSNKGQISFGNHLYVNINKLFANGYSKEQPLLAACENSKANRLQGIIEGKDVSIVAAHYINLGMFEIANLDVTSETTLNTGSEFTSHNRKTAVINVGQGMELPNWKECGQDIQKFIRLVEYYGTGEVLQNWDKISDPKTYASKLAERLLPINKKNSTTEIADKDDITTGNIQSNSLYRYTTKNTEAAVNVIKRFKEAKEEQALTKAHMEFVSGEKFEHSGEDYAQYNYSQVDERVEHGKVYANCLKWQGSKLKTSAQSLLNTKRAIINEISATFHGKNIGDSMKVTAEQLHLAETSKTEMEDLLEMNAKNITLDGAITTEKLFSHSKELTKANGPIKAVTASLTSYKQVDMNGQLNIGDGVVQAPIINDKANTQFSKRFTLKADRLKMSQQSRTRGDGTLKIDAHTAEMHNIDAKKVDVTLDHVPNVKDFLMQRSSNDVHARESLRLQVQDPVTLDEAMNLPYSVALAAPGIDITAPITGNQNLEFRATQGDLHTFSNVSAKKVLIFDARNNYLNNRSTMTGGEALFVHAGGNVTNRAGILMSPVYAEIVTDHGDVINEAIQFTVPGQYGPMQQYIPAYIYGGTGVGHQNYGLFVQSGGKLINDASFIHSLGSNYLNAYKGIESLARCNQYRSYHKEWHNFWRDKETNEYKYQLQPAGINSIYGKNTLVSENGPIYFLSTEMFGNQGNELSAKGPIDLRGLVLETRCVKDATAGFGLLRDHIRETREVNMPTVVVDYKDTRMVSLSDINILNARLIGGDLVFIGNNVNISAPILNHAYEQESWGFDCSLPNLSQIPGYSLLFDARAYNKGNAIEKLASAWNTGVDFTNTLNSAALAVASKNPLLGLCAPSLEFSYGRTHQKSNYQTLADNVGVDRFGSMYVRANDRVAFLNGVPIFVAGDASLNAKRFLQQSAALKSSNEYDSESITAGIGLDGKPRIGARASYSASEQTNHVNQFFRVGGGLETNFGEWEMNGANTVANNWYGNIGKLSIITPLNTGKSMSASAEANTGGVVSASYSESDYALVGSPSGILVLRSINGANDPRLHVGQTYMLGGKILAQGENNYETDSLIAEDLNEYRNGYTLGFTACTGNEKENSQAISNMPLQLGYDHFRARQRSTVYGNGGAHPVSKQGTGNLNTENDDGHVVKSNTRFNIAPKIPTGGISKGLEKTRKNANSAQETLKEKIFGTRKQAPAPVPIRRHSVKPKLERKPADDVKGSDYPVKKSGVEKPKPKPAAPQSDKAKHTNKGSSSKSKPNSKLNLDKMTQQDEKRSLKPKFTPISGRNDKFMNLILQGKVEEAKRIARESASQKNLQQTLNKVRAGKSQMPSNEYLMQPSSTTATSEFGLDLSQASINQARQAALNSNKSILEKTNDLAFVFNQDVAYKLKQDWNTFTEHPFKTTGNFIYETAKGVGAVIIDPSLLAMGINQLSHDFYNADSIERTHMLANGTVNLIEGEVATAGLGGVVKLAASVPKLVRAARGFTLFDGRRGARIANIEKTMQKIEEYMGPGMVVEKPLKGSDLILRSADGTKQIRFDITKPHGLEPHVNIETWKPRNRFPNDKRMVIDENLHIYPKNDLVNGNEFKKQP